MRWMWVLLLLPLASGQFIDNPDESTPVTLWMHCIGEQDCMMNTQTPRDAAYEDSPAGLLVVSQGCQDVPGLGLVSRTHHTTYGYSSAGEVVYDENGRPSYHNTRGLATDVELDRDVGPTVTWYVALHAGTTGPDGPPMVAPRTRVDVTLRQGDDLSVNHESFNTGERIAWGSLGPVELHPLQATAPEVAPNIYRFDVPLIYDELERIDRREAFNIRIDVITDVPGCNRPASDAYATLPSVQSHAGGGFHPRLDFAIFNPISIQHITPHIEPGAVVITVSAISPWGNYDLLGTDAPGEQMTLSWDGPTAPTDVVLQPITHTNVHGSELLPLQASWVWNTAREPGAPGTYTAMVRVTNDQGTANATAAATFDLGTGRSHGCHHGERGIICGHAAEAPTETTPLPWTLGLVAVAFAGRHKR